MCFVLGLFFGSTAKRRAPTLSSKIVEYILISLLLILIYLFNNSMVFLISIKSRVLYEKEMYLASVVLRATSVCSLLTQLIGQLANLMI